MLRISIEHGHIKGSSSRFPMEKFPLCRQASPVMALPWSQCWLGYTTSIEEWLKRFKRSILLPKEIEFRISLWF